MYSNDSHFINLFYKNKLYTKKKNPRTAIFADRDGVIIKEKHFLSSSSEVELEEGSISFLNSAYRANIPVIIITNQSGIARGFFSWNDYEEVTKKMMKMIGENNPIIAIFANGLPPNAPKNSWRKPSPEMVNSACSILNIEKKNSLIIGDRLTDIQCGINAGISNLIHLKTGHGKNESKDVFKYVNNLKNSKLFQKKANFLMKESIGDINLLDYPSLIR